jgi:hypothetical protein
MGSAVRGIAFPVTVDGKDIRYSITLEGPPLSIEELIPARGHEVRIIAKPDLTGGFSFLRFDVILLVEKSDVLKDLVGSGSFRSGARLRITQT